MACGVGLAGQRACAPGGLDRGVGDVRGSGLSGLATAAPDASAARVADLGGSSDQESSCFRAMIDELCGRGRECDEKIELTLISGFRGGDAVLVEEGLPLGSMLDGSECFEGRSMFLDDDHEGVEVDRMNGGLKRRILDFVLESVL